MTTKPTIALKDLIEKCADADLLRQMIGEIVQQIMAADVENLCNASYGERSAERAASAPRHPGIDERYGAAFVVGDVARRERRVAGEGDGCDLRVGLADRATRGTA